MKEFIQYLLYDARHSKEKISDKMLAVKIGFSVVMILFCVAVMSLSAFAFFTHNMTTQVNSIQAASYDLEIASDDGLVAGGNGAYLLDNSAGTEEKIYLFTLQKSAESTASVGYCKIMVATDMVNNAKADGLYHYYSQPIGTYLENGAEVTVEKRTIYIRVAPLRKAEVTFSSQWGSTAEEPLEDKQYAWPGFSPQTAEEEALIKGEDPAQLNEQQSDEQQEGQSAPAEQSEGQQEDLEEDNSAQPPEGTEGSEEEQEKSDSSGESPAEGDPAEGDPAEEKPSENAEDPTEPNPDEDQSEQNQQEE